MMGGAKIGVVRGGDGEREVGVLEVGLGWREEKGERLSTNQIPKHALRTLWKPLFLSMQRDASCPVSLSAPAVPACLCLPVHSEPLQSKLSMPAELQMHVSIDGRIMGLTASRSVTRVEILKGVRWTKQA